ncbi:HD domain-containing protein [Actinocrispum wychmicini]|uniref:Histidine kinase/DNA gyrase B/HSP90-like ATPase n=1 Tax=Actinocrispum wychmicini TaxID=1213861 RepID=A0A4R2INJ3_9PSEU|nr:ATP-binding protein [Actinocrispum wychmicini]TCO45936.1 histidine kinase/DNA gyrase B/HSP90-like ATPase [Actinocrispum wychmicini]
MTKVLSVGTPEHPVLDVVFIHGLDGDARKTWSRKEKESFWPKWLAEEFVDVAVWTVDYDAWSSGWRGQSMPLQDRAGNLMMQLRNHGIGERPLCFVTHSMGGLLAKEILLQAAEARTEFAVFAAQTKGVVFFATPHTGADLTKAVQTLGVVYRATPAVSDLERDQPYLRNLSDRYRNWVDKVEVQNLVFFEAHRTMGTRVVDPTSANPGLAGTLVVAVDANHRDICKPADRDSVVYRAVKRFVNDLRSPEQHAHAWAQLVGRQSLWIRSGTEEDDPLRRECVAAADHLALRRHEAEEALPGDPWLEADLAERIADEVERLFDFLGESAPELTAAEGAVLSLAPLVYQVHWVRRASSLSRIKPTTLEQTGSSDPDRDAYERFLHLPRWGRLVSRARVVESEAIAWWLFHRWEAGAPRVGTGDLLDGLLAEVPIATDLANILGQVVAAMRLGVDELKHVDKPVRWVSGIPVREQLLSLILLLARAWAIELLTLSPTVVEHLGIGEPVELDHLRKAVRGRHWNPAQRDTVTLQAACRHEAEYEALREHAAWVDALLHAVRRFAEYSSPLGSLRALPTRASADDVKPERESGKPAFEVPITRFRMDESRIQELLMGKRLYGDPALAIRELYQNALDACRYRKACHDYQAKVQDGLNAEWQGQITFTQGVDSLGRAYLQCTDDGVGMNKEELRSVFAIAGTRLVERAEFQRQWAKWQTHGVRFAPNSQFGIGVLSYFMIADKIVVTTRRMDTTSDQPSPALEVTIAGPGHLFRIRKAVDQSVKIGTTVRLYLRDPGPRAAPPSCVDLLRKVLGVAEHRTVADHEGRRETWSTELVPRERPAWDQDGINAHGVLVQCEAVPGGGQVIWCEHGGALLVDGLYLRPDVRRGVLADPGDALEPFGVVINLVDDWRPELSVNRALALGDVSDHVRTLLTRSVDTLFEKMPSIFTRTALTSRYGVCDLVRPSSGRPGFVGRGGRSAWLEHLV